MTGGDEVARLDGDAPPPRDFTRSALARLRAGDAEAAALLTQLYHDPLMRFAWGYLGNPHDAEDAVQDVLLKVQALSEPPENFRAWLYRTARNHCLNLRRSRGRRRDDAALHSGFGPPATFAGQLTRLVRAEQRSRVGHLLAALPQQYREVLWLRYVEGLSRSEVATVLELEESLVKSRLYDGLRKLREHTSLFE